MNCLQNWEEGEPKRIIVNIKIKTAIVSRETIAVFCLLCVKVGRFVKKLKLFLKSSRGFHKVA
jgi:hypothetical protein